jgi:hypothetical protein
MIDLALVQIEKPFAKQYSERFLYCKRKSFLMTSKFTSLCHHAGWLVLAMTIFCHTGPVVAQKIDGDRLLDPDRLVEVHHE